MRFYITILVLLLWSSAMNAQSAGLTVISNPNGSPSELKFAELRSILMGERQRWRNGSKIFIALMKTNTEVGKRISEQIYGMGPDEVKKHWLALVFQGKAHAPTFFNTASELQAFVAENPGAIGVIDQPSAVYQTQIVSVDGKKVL